MQVRRPREPCRGLRRPRAAAPRGPCRGFQGCRNCRMLRFIALAPPVRPPLDAMGTGIGDPAAHPRAGHLRGLDRAPAPRRNQRHQLGRAASRRPGRVVRVGVEVRGFEPPASSVRVRTRSPLCGAAFCRSIRTIRREVKAFSYAARRLAGCCGPLELWVATQIRQARQDHSTGGLDPHTLGHLGPGQLGGYCELSTSVCNAARLRRLRTVSG